MPLAVPELIWFALLLFAFAVVYSLRKLIEGLFSPLIGILSGIPVIGSALSGVLHSIEQAVAHALGGVEGAIDSAIGATFHQLSRLTDWLWREFKSHAAILAQLSVLWATVILAVKGLRALVHQLTHSSTAHSKQLTRVEHRLHVLDKRIEALQDQVAAGIGEDVLPRLKVLEREANTIRTKTIPAIQAADAQAESAISDLWTWIHKNALVAGTTTFVAAVTAALGTMGLGHLTCPGFLSFLKKWGCGLGSLLDRLLGLMIAGLALETVCEFLGLFEAAFGAVIGPVVHLLNEVPLGDCEKPDPKWATLSVAHGPLPPPQTPGSFPA